MPTWQPQGPSGLPVVEFSSSSNQELVFQLSISEPKLALIALRQFEEAISAPLGGDLSLTSAEGFFRLEYNSNNPLISSLSSSSNFSLVAVGFAEGVQNLWINGELIGSGSSNTLPQSFNSIGEAFSGQIAEVLIFDQQTSFFNRQKIEGYLAHKWQLTSQLPELHPYASTPPSFGGSQNITWLGTDGNSSSGLLQLPVKETNDADFSLDALASSGLPVVFSSSAPNLLTIAGNQAKILGPGTVTITAYQNGSIRYQPATPESVELEIIDLSDPLFIKDEQTIIFNSIPLKVREDPPFEVHALATSSALRHPKYNLPVTIKIESGPATLDSRGVITLDGTAGMVVLSASQSGNAYVKAAPTIFQSFEVSSKTRPTVLFSDFKKEGPLNDVLLSAVPAEIIGAYSSNGARLALTSSDPSVIEIVGQNKIVTQTTGTVTLTFNIPANENFASASPITRTLKVVAATKNAWLENRRNDPRYQGVKDRFLTRRIAKLENWNEEQAGYEFDQDEFDSDGWLR